MLPNRLESLLRRLEAGGIDIVHSRTPENITKTIGVLESLDAVFRIQPERRLRPNATHLAGPGPLNSLTSLGPLDLLGEVGHNHLDYQKLLPHSNIAMLAILKQTLKEARKNQP